MNSQASNTSLKLPQGSHTTPDWHSSDMLQEKNETSVYQMESRRLWEPKYIDTHMEKFRKLINTKYNVNLANYFDLYQWSVECYPQFWGEVWRFCEVIHSKTYENVVDKEKRIEEIPEWFQGALLNYSENLLRYRDDSIALYVAGEGYPVPLGVTYNELYDKVSLYASVLKKYHVQSGNRVVGYLPNGLEAVVAMLATASLGAIWSSTSPDFGVAAVIDRFYQIQPKVMFSVDKVIYGGKIHGNLGKLREITEGLPSLEAIFISPNIEDSVPDDMLSIPKSYFLPGILEEIKDLNNGIPPMEFVQVPFGHPLYILYSSGTTGSPKCMVHSVGGTLIKHLTEHILHSNMTRKDVIMFYTTTGWMMWNWLVTSLAVGSTVVLYDGSPFFPDSNAIWDLVDLLGISILGTGAKWLAMCEDKGLVPQKTHNLKSLRAILSTGSPLSPHSFDYVYQNIKADVLLGSITGGSDIVSCFAGQNPTMYVHRGEIQCRLLGMAVECFDEDGSPVRGAKGELVCTKPAPCMPIYFWNDPRGEKYKKAYFNKFTGVWSHGDFCAINPATEGIIMLGRSDGTLNPNGVRFGSAEIYNVVEAIKEVQDSICVSQYGKVGEERVVLFLRLIPGYTLTKELVSEVRSRIRKELSARHVPSVILQIEDIPYTVSGKKVEVAVKKIIAGEIVTNKESISNPESLSLYSNVPELKDF